jgi:hypothetical protein
MAHANLCRIVGFSYERGRKGSDRRSSVGFIVWEEPRNGSLYELLHGRPSYIIDWATRLKIAIGIADGIAFLLDNMPNQVQSLGFRV